MYNIEFSYLPFWPCNTEFKNQLFSNLRENSKISHFQSGTPPIPLSESSSLIIRDNRFSLRLVLLYPYLTLSAFSLSLSFSPSPFSAWFFFLRLSQFSLFLQNVEKVLSFFHSSHDYSLICLFSKINVFIYWLSISFLFVLFF